MNDERFSVIRYSAVRDTLTAVFGVLIILWLAVRSWKIIAAVFFSLVVGAANFFSVISRFVISARSQ